MSISKPYKPITALILPRLRPDQYSIAIHPAKRKVWAAGRRVGKSTLAGCLTINVLRQHGKTAWIAPTYKNSRALWRWAVNVVAGRDMFDVSKSEQIITTKQGGMLALYSGDNIDAVRSEWFHLVVADEAARLKEEEFLDAVEPTLADVDGDLLLIGTPRGKNWFWREYEKAKQAGAAWRSPTSDNPLPQIQEAFAKARERRTARSFRQEWLAEFVEGGGEVFRFVEEAATLEPQGPDGGTYVIGADWGKRGDFTVFSVVDAVKRQLAYQDRFTGVDYVVAEQRLAALRRRYNASAIVAERNAMGEPIVERLQRAGLPVIPFLTTSATKATIVEALALAFENRQIGILKDETLIGELEAFEATETASGLTRYAAPEGMHDDCVMALALAWSAAQDAQPIVAFEIE